MSFLSVVLTILTLVGSIGLFLYGMKLMSEALQKVAGQRMRSALSTLTLNPFRGLASGLVLTAAIQSSSASTVMITGLVNAGLLSLRQSIPLILGANIGTTLKVWIIASIGFRLDLNLVLLPVIAMSLLFLFSSIPRKKSVGELLMGFGLLFLGLELLKNSLPPVSEIPQLVAFLREFNSGGYLSILFFVVVGAVFTAIIQSSSASITLTLAMLNSGWFSYDLAVAMLLGENIGTTITANLAALVANTHAKRAALSHFLFNLIGVAFVLLWFYPFINITGWITTAITGQVYSDSSAAMLLGLSVVHTFFNILNALIWVNLVPVMVRLTIFIFPDKVQALKTPPRFIRKSHLLGTSEFSILQAKKQVHTVSRLVNQFFNTIPELLVEKEPEAYKSLQLRIASLKQELEIAAMSVDQFLDELNENDLSPEGRTRKKVMVYVNEQFRNIMTVNLKMIKIVEEKNQRKVWFTPKQRLNLKKMFDLVKESIRAASENLSGEYHLAQFEYAHEIENSINLLRDKLRQKNLENIEKGKYTVEGGNYYNDLFSLSEKVGDYILLINDSLTSCRLQLISGTPQ
ncbi:MAG: hypothetical protein A2X11_02100 [Bacteroidetes bacterium GWE2_42_24]|nr:MAG: hypothetical protein A2X11_02100 [Bacteroidetes bacterium GWE2_42_24]OFY29071.1 MAG: hypothetical protein A2X09_16050 [Bacteroidetes bacterium GWF2_43_11]